MYFRQNSCPSSKTLMIYGKIMILLLVKLYNLCRWCIKVEYIYTKLTICQYWFRWWLGASQATSHYLNQWWPSLLMHICITWRQWVKALKSNILTTKLCHVTQWPDVKINMQNGHMGNYFIHNFLRSTSMNKLVLFMILGSALQTPSPVC